MPLHLLPQPNRRDFLRFSATGAALTAAGMFPTPSTSAATAPTAASRDPKAIRLIVRGDDMGFSNSGNEALIKCYREGIETSIEVIAPSPWFPEAGRMLMVPENVGVDVGVHLALTSEWDNMKWRPLTSSPSLVDADGYFFPMVRPNKNYPGRSIVENKWKLEEIEREFRAQIELVRKYVPRVSHVSAHMGCSTLAPEVAAMTTRITKELGVDIDLADFGVKQIRYLGPKGTAEEKLGSFLKALESMQAGSSYCFVDHPGLDTPELRAISHIGYENVSEDRQGVTKTWTHPRVKSFIKERGIQLIAYRDLKR